MKRLILLLVLIFVFGCIEQKTGADEGKGKWVATETGMFLTPNATAIVIEAPDCFACDYADYILLVSEREDLGTRITNITRLSHNSTQAKLLISRYKIGKVPVLILKKDTEWDHRMLSWWNSAIGTYETERTLVMREVYPPYYDLETGEFRGFVEIRVLVNKSCTVCYDANAAADEIISAFKLIATKEEIDVGSEEGRELIERYGITDDSGYIMNSDALEYPGFEEFWVSEGNTIEEDGWLVSRKIK